MNLIDTHAHLYWENYKQSLPSDEGKPDLEEVLKRAKDAGVTTIINIGVDLEKSQEALDQVQNKLNIPGMSFYSTIGIHPHEANTFVHEDIDKLEQIYLSCPEKIVAIGECGLDFFFENNPGFNTSSVPEEKQKQLQRQLFQVQINLAKKLNLPLVVHCRDDRSRNPQNSECWDEVLKMVGNQPTILHCYSGLPQNTKYIIQNANLYVSFAANITYPKNEYLREAVKLLPLNRILLETDSPFLTPQSKRGQRNEPSAVMEIAQLIAELKGISFEKVASLTSNNAKMLFNI